MPPTSPHVAAAAALLCALVLSAPAVAGVIRSCGPDPIGNTAAVLCAPPSGPCDASTVVIGASITVLDSACAFDLEGRALRVERTLEVTGGGQGKGFVIANAGDVAIMRRGRLKSRGDLGRHQGEMPPGGDVAILSAGTIDVAGTIDTSGSWGGIITLDGDRGVVIARSAKIRSNGIGGFIDTGFRIADGGSLQVSARHGDVRYAGTIQMRGTNGGTGGDVDFSAANDADIGGKTDVSGGNGVGGDFFASAGDDLRIDGAVVNARSRLGGSDGGFMDLRGGYTYWAAFSDTPSGVRRGGTLTITASRFDLRASVNDKGFAGNGGGCDAAAVGALTVADDVSFRADGAGATLQSDGAGGLVSFYAEELPADPATGEPEIRGDITLGGLLSLRSGSPDGIGGDVYIEADRDLVLRARVDIGGTAESGGFFAGAGRDVLVSGPIAANADGADSVGGKVQIVAGFREPGTLRIAEDIRASGGARNGNGPQVALVGCPVTVDGGVTIDASGGVGAGTPPSLAIYSGRPLQLNAGTRLLAGPAGTINVTHPATQDPVVPSGVRIDPSPLVDTVVPAEHFPQCPRCGDGPGDECAPIVRIDGVTSDGHRVDVATTVASPLDLPLTGNVALCEELGIEDVTFTWAATTCDGVHDTLELLINDTVVADVSAHIDTGCACLVGPAFPSYSVPLDEARALLVPGINRFGIRKSEGEPGRERTRLAWAYATVRVWGNTERIPVFDHRDVFAPVGVSSFDDPMICEGAAQSGAVDSAGEGVVCGAVWSEDWTGTLPCGLDVSGLGEQRDYTVVIRATDGVATTPVTAAATFTRASEPFLSLDGCVP